MSRVGASFAALLLAAPALANSPDDGLNPSLSGGGWSHVVPLELPAAKAGLVPELAVVFDFRSGDGVLGRQWQLAGLSRIERTGTYGAGVPQYWDMDDRFTVDGQLLYEEGGGFAPEQDDERDFQYQVATNTWTATREGWTWTWGGYVSGPDGCAVESVIDSAAAPCEARSTTPSRDQTTSWLLSSVQDPWGNTIEYSYRSLADVDPDLSRLGGDASYAQKHVIDTIKYAGGQHTISFSYNPRADEVIDSSSGWPRVLPGRLERISVSSSGGLASVAGAAYEIVYGDESAGDDCSDPTERSSWSSVTATAGTGLTEFERIVRTKNGLTGSSGGKSLRCATRTDDSDGWAASGAVSMDFVSGTTSSATRTFSDARFTTHSIVNFDGGPESEVLEVRADTCQGAVHLQATQPSQVGRWYYSEPGCDQSLFDATLWQVDAAAGTLVETSNPVLDYLLDHVQSLVLESYYYSLLDVDRDGLTDLLYVDESLVVYLVRSDGLGGTTETELPLDFGPSLLTDLEEATFADVNGDGLVDLVRPLDWYPNIGVAPYWDTTSSESFDSPVSPAPEDAAGLPRGWNEFGALLDWNGDGLADFVAASDGVGGIPSGVTSPVGDDVTEMVYFGQGDGSFVEGFDPGLEPIDWVTLPVILGGTVATPAEVQFPAQQSLFVDADLDGRLEQVTTSDLGLPEGSFGWQNEGGSFVQLFADWTGDGFPDSLYLEFAPIQADCDEGSNGVCDATDDYNLGSSGNGIAVLYPGARTKAEGRVESIQTAWGGEIALTYGQSADGDRNSLMPWSTDVVRTVTDEHGTTEYDYDGGVWWPEFGRFLGFRDLIVARETGSSTHVRYGVSPWSAGREVYRSDRRTDGSIEFFAYNSVRETVTGGTTLDLAAPFFNPTRERCTAWVGYAAPGAGGIAVQSVDEGQLINECECSAGAPVASPPPDGEPQDPPPGAPPPNGPPPPPQGPPPPPIGNQEPVCTGTSLSVLFDVYGWAAPEEWFYAPEEDQGVWTVYGADPSTFDNTDPVDPSDWRPSGIPSSGTRSYAATASALPADLWEPDATPPARWGGEVTDYILRAEAWTYNAFHRVSKHRDLGDVENANDQRTTSYTWLTWDTAASGQRLSSKKTWAVAETTDALTESYAYGSAFNEVTGVTQTRSGSSWSSPSARAWARQWSEGEIVREEDPDGVRHTYTRNACGQVLSREARLSSAETWTYDAGCKLLSWSFLSGASAWTYDDYGRVATASQDPGGPGATVVQTHYRSGNSAYITTGSSSDTTPNLHVSTLDAWGREESSIACEPSGASTPSCVVNTASKVVRGWAADGSQRFATTAFDPDLSSPDTLSAVWTYHDEWGRSEVTWTPGHEVAQSYVRTDMAWEPGVTTSTDPVGLSCITEYDSTETTRSCAGVDRGTVLRDEWGRAERETDPDGVSTDFSYDAFDRLAKRKVDATVAFDDGPAMPQVSYTWTSGDRLWTQTDNADVVTTLSYDLDGRKTTAVVDGPYAPPVTVEDLTYLEITVSGELVAIVWSEDLDGNDTWTLYDALGRPFSTTLPDGSTAWLDFNSRGMIAETHDVDGLTTTYAHDALGRVTSELRTGLSTSPSYTYDAAGRVVAAADRDGVASTVTYTRSGLVQSMYRERSGTASDWLLAEYAYDDDGRVATATRSGVETTYGYDALRRVDEICEGPVGAVCTRKTALDYTDADRISDSWVSDAGLTAHTQTEYDELGNVVRVVHPGGADEEYAWYKSGRLARHTNERGLETTWAYDNLGRTTREDLPGALARTWSYTNGVSTGSGIYGTEVLRTEPDGGDFTTQMDFAGRAVFAENPYGETTSWAYEGSQLKAVAYGFGGTDLAMEKYGYDTAGRMEWRWGPEAAATMSASSPAAGNYAYWYAYSDAGRLLSREGPNDLTEWEWTDGVKTAEVVSGVSTTTYTYASDAPRVLEKLVGDASQLRATSYSYDNLGRLEEAFTDDGAETVLQTWYDRDIYDQPRSQSREVSGVIESTLTRTTNARGWTLTQSMETPTRSVEASYQREVDGALKEQWVQWGGGSLRGVEFVRGGAEGQLTQLRDPSGTTPFASSFVRDDAGRITSVTANGGATTSTDYDLLGRISNRTVTQGSDYRSIDYVYDHRGRVEEVTRTSPTATKTSSFIYDEPGWLSLETHVDAAGTRSIAYGYDDAGNRTSRAETTSAGTTTRTFTYDYGNVLASVNGAAPVWNAFGETEEDHRGAGIVRAADGAEIGLVGPPSGGGAGTALYAFTRGAGGEATEVEDLVAGGLRSFLWGAGEADFPVSTLDEGGIEQMYVAAEGMVLGRLDGGTFVPMAQDAQGSMLLDGADFLDVGAAFGEDATHVSGSPERRVYALLEDLPGTPYKLPRRRLYDEETGRFASQDPIGLMGGDHRFAYVGGDPMGAVDPSGLLAAMPTGVRTLRDYNAGRQAPDVLRKSCWGKDCANATYAGVSADEGANSPVGGAHGVVAKGEHDATAVQGKAEGNDDWCGADARGCEEIEVWCPIGECTKTDAFDRNLDLAVDFVNQNYVAFPGTVLDLFDGVGRNGFNIDVARKAQLARLGQLAVDAGALLIYTQTGGLYDASEALETAGDYYMGMAEEAHAEDADSAGLGTLAGDVAAALATSGDALAVKGAGVADDLVRVADDMLEVATDDAVKLVDDVAQKLGACFRRGTLVLSLAGMVSIESIDVGDYVLARDDQTGEVDWERVVAVSVRPIDAVVHLDVQLPLGGEQEIVTTSEHPFWTRDEGWTVAGELEVGDEVWSVSAGWSKVGAVAWELTGEPVYNLTVEDKHTYFVGDAGIWVHNAPTCSQGAAEGGVIREVEIQAGKGHKMGAEMSRGDAVDSVRGGGDVCCGSKGTAREVAEQAGDGPPVHDPPHAPGQLPHYHPTSGGERSGGHVLYGKKK